MNNKQSISLGSIQNARELGGYTTAEGRRIKNGLLLRTARLNNIEACKKGNRKTATGNRAFVQDCMNKDNEPRQSAAPKWCYALPGLSF